MSLLAIEEVLPLLVCPRCRGKLQYLSRGPACSDPACTCAAGGVFAMTDRQPILLDPELSIASTPADLDEIRGPRITRQHRSPAGRWARRLFTPYNEVAAAHAEQIRQGLKSRPGRPLLLIVGGGSVGNGAESLYQDPAVPVIGFDLYASPNTQFVADGHAIPLPDASVHAVWIQAVLEHVLDPWRVVGEVHRVLAPEGLVYAETPFLQAVHEGPHDFTRFTESGHRWMFRRFEALDSGVVAGPFLSLAWAIDYAAAGLFRSRMAGRLARLPFFWLPWLDRLVPARYAVDGASCVFFMGRKSSAELRPAEIVHLYRGAQSSGEAQSRATPSRSSSER